ncbi:hypothetical protein SAMN05443550_112146 [Pedobacter hartonius]|uniref:FCP1 homology domain-containing protein n=2 Tax=Pedobacter hartonius TaxID=425514 RepID=A0A1H4H0I1_9SPHI|nr:hypothetical protein SAMN05443550_112146 [Pedobacter hartonius]
MEQITSSYILDYLKNNEIHLASTHAKLCTPIIRRMCQKMWYIIRFGEIKLCDDMYVLLDIDGVMVPAQSWKRPEFLQDGFPVFSLKSIQALQKIINKTDATLVLTTSHKSIYSISEWKDIFKLRGISVSALDRLTANDLNLSRKEEILQWYNSGGHSDDQIVIIDDDKSLHALPFDMKQNLVMTSPMVRLTDELADDAISILKAGALAPA